jgi:thiamine biosynthesis lipoprotein ApbE
MNISGNLYLYKLAPVDNLNRSFTDFTVSIRNAVGDGDGVPFASLLVRDESAVTSGDYERFYVQDGIKYAHILDTRTGYPVNTVYNAEQNAFTNAPSGLISVTVFDKSSENADINATIALVLGMHDGITYLSERGLKAVMYSESVYAAVGDVRLNPKRPELAYRGLAPYEYNGVPMGFAV